MTEAQFYAVYIPGAVVAAIVGTLTLAWCLARNARTYWSEETRAELPLYKRIDGEVAAGGSVLVVIVAAMWPIVTAIGVVGALGYTLVQGMEYIQDRQEKK